MPGFLVRPSDVGPDQLVLRGAEAHHAVRVRRLGEGDQLEVGDGHGLLYEVRIDAIEPDQVHCRILARRADAGESPVRLVLAAALIKGSRFDYLVEKATEAGVDTVVPMVSKRCVAQAGSARKQERWGRLAAAAAKQCGRSRVPQVLAPLPFAEALALLAEECPRRLIALAARGEVGLAGALAGGPWARLGLVIGPEGGFAGEEEAQAIEAGCVPFSWGQRVLRAETAGVVLSALVLYEAETQFTR